MVSVKKAIRLVSPFTGMVEKDYHFEDIWFEKENENETWIVGCNGYSLLAVKVEYPIEHQRFCVLKRDALKGIYTPIGYDNPPFKAVIPQAGVWALPININYLVENIVGLLPPDMQKDKNETLTIASINGKLTIMNWNNYFVLGYVDTPDIGHIYVNYKEFVKLAKAVAQAVEGDEVVFFGRDKETPIGFMTENVIGLLMPLKKY